MTLINKTLFSIILILLFICNSIAQVKTIRENLETTGLNPPQIKHIEGKGILVAICEDNLKRFAHNITYSFKFYNEKFEKKWEIDKIGEVISKKSKNYIKAVAEAADNSDILKISTDGKYAFLSEMDKVYKIDVENGTFKSIDLKSSNWKYNGDYSVFIDKSYYYSISSRNPSNKTHKTNVPVKVTRLNIETSEVKHYMFELPPVGPSKKDKDGFVNLRKWMRAHISDGNCYFLDSKSNVYENKYCRRILKVDLEGNINLDKNIVIGDNVKNDRRDGAFIFDPFQEQRIYSYSVPQINGETHAKFECYDMDLNTSWTRILKLKNQAISKRQSHPFDINKINNNYVFSSVFNDDRVLLEANNNKPGQIIITEKNCSKNKNLIIDCKYYNELIKNDEISSFLKKYEEKVEITPIYTKDYIIIVKEPILTDSKNIAIYKPKKINIDFSIFNK